LRVIAGRFRGRKLHAPRGLVTRPTADRARQALFEILGPLSNQSVLDLYAGTGALGIEALSRGAARAVFVESHGAALSAIRKNLGELDLESHAVVLPIAVERSARALRDQGPFDLVLCDPPWNSLDAALRAVERLLSTELMAPGARLVIEHPAERTLELDGLPNLVKSDLRRWGDTGASLFVKGER
jgi:16S rRNA (guanine(966)-N(2))-methyltransferase RsmD